MPAFLLGTSRGYVRSLVPAPGAVGTIVSGVKILRSMITRVGLSMATNTQFLHTLGDMVYVYSFGDRINEVALTGLSFFDCDMPGRHGVADVIAWYRANRVARAPQKIAVTIGGVVFPGYLTSLRVDTSSADSCLLEFQLTFQALQPL